MASKARELANLGNAYSDGALSNRNLIINGAMQVAQRGTSATGVNSGFSYRTCDRFKVALDSLGTWTVEQSTDAPSGFSNSMKLTTTTANASPTSGSYAILWHLIEAQNLQQLAYGTSGAKQVTVSFWVKSNKTGPASFTILQMDNSEKLISPSYSINSANTWEYKTIVIAADTAGNIANDNGSGFLLEWWLNCGSNYTGGTHRTSWITQNTSDRNPSNLGVGGTVNDYFAITGVQLEVGDTATPFEHRSYGQELALCQRYYWESARSLAYYAFQYVSSNKFLQINHPVPMRVTPTATVVYNMGSFAEYATDQYQYKAYIGSSYTDGNSYTTTSAKFDAEL